MNTEEIKNIQLFLDFIEKNKNNFEKRKYFNISKEFKILKKEPSFIIELSYFYYKNSGKNSDLYDTILSEFQETFKDKEKKIDRKSKLELSKLSDSFRRTLVNQDVLHSLKLGNELLIRDKNIFFKIIYTISLISKDQNKFIKVYFLEKIINNILKYDNNLNKNKSQISEIIKNTINYFVKSENEFIDFNCENSINYFIENKADLLYRKIYIENFDKIIEKYNISLNIIKKINFNISDFESEIEKLSISKKQIYNYL